MGHFYPDNIGRFFLREIRRHGSVTFKEAIDRMVEHGVTFNAGEGSSKEAYELEWGLMANFELWVRGEEQDIVRPLLTGKSKRLPRTVREFIAKEYDDGPPQWRGGFGRIRWELTPYARNLRVRDLPLCDFIDT